MDRPLSIRERAMEHARKARDEAEAKAKEALANKPANIEAPSSSRDAGVVEVVDCPFDLAVSLNDKLDAINAKLDAMEARRGEAIEWEGVVGKLRNMLELITDEQARELADVFGAFFDKTRPAKGGDPT